MAENRTETFISLSFDSVNLIRFFFFVFKATFNQLGGEKGGKIKKKQAKSGVVRKQTQQQNKAKTAVKAKPKQRKSKEITKPSVCDHEKQTKAVSLSPSGAISSFQDSMEESTSSQDSLQISRLVQIL